MSDRNGSQRTPTPPSGAASEVRPRVGCGRVMVVDDDAVVRDVVQRILRAHGFDVVVCASGEDAAGLYRTLASAIDLILVDMCMPGMDGYDTFHALRATRADALVVLYSGAADPARIQQGLQDGAWAFLPKPFTPEALVGLIHGALAETRVGAPPCSRAAAK